MDQIKVLWWKCKVCAVSRFVIMYLLIIYLCLFWGKRVYFTGDSQSKISTTTTPNRSALMVRFLVNVQCDGC